MCGLLAMVVRKGLNFESILCGLSPPRFGGRAASLHLYPVRRREQGGHDWGGAAAYPPSWERNQPSTRVSNS